jgi:hypothetical protein
LTFGGLSVSPGAVTIFQPIQPILGALGLALASIALAIRLRGIRRGCRVDLSKAI